MMNKKIIGVIFFAILFVGIFSVFTMAKDDNVENVQSMIDALPVPEDIKDLTLEEQGDVYNHQHIPAGNAYEALTEEQKSKVDTTRMDALNAYFNTLIEPITIQE